MKRISYILVAVLALSLFGASDAMAKKKNQSTGLKGKIVSVSKGTLMVQIHQKGGGAGLAPTAIHTDANTTVEINGVSGKHVSDLQAGDRVVIAGDTTATVTDIQAKRHGGKHKKA